MNFLLDCFKNYNYRLEDTSTGGILYLTSIDKNYSASIYWYDDEPEILYLSNIHVVENQRKNGLGNNLLNSLQEICKTTGCKQIMLSCNKSFVYGWYKRNGFVDLIKENNYAIGWMVKNI